MAAKLRILYNHDAWDAATITSSSEASSHLADDNVVDDNPARPWRTDDEQDEWIKFDLGSAQQITCVALFNFNLSSGATVRLQANSSDSFGSPPYDQALTIVTDADSVVFKRLVFFLDQTYQWWRITVDDYPNTDGYIQIGRIVGGAYYEMSRNYSEQFGIQIADPSEGREVPGAFSPKRSQEDFRTITLDFEFVEETERDKWEAIFRKIGNRSPVVLALDPTDRPTKDSAYCVLKTPLQIAHRLIEQYDVLSSVWEEKVR